MIEVRSVAKAFTASSAKAPGWAGALRRAASRTTVHAVRDVSFRAPAGAITGLLGPNGAGKTTTLRMLGALVTPDAGSLEVDGIDVARRPREVLARLGMLSDARAQDLARMFDMVPLLDRRTEGFSQGERMKTALARALVHDPANIVLDEPTNGLDVLATRALRESLRWLRTPEGGSKCIVFSTHIMQEVERLCDSVVVVAHGRTVASGTVEELLAQTGEHDFEEAFVRLAFDPEQAS